MRHERALAAPGVVTLVLVLLAWVRVPGADDPSVTARRDLRTTEATVTAQPGVLVVASARPTTGGSQRVGAASLAATTEGVRATGGPSPAGHGVLGSSEGTPVAIPLADVLTRRGPP